jgi:hypothetical protein
MEFLQTGLNHLHLDTRPRQLKIQFATEISPQMEQVSVRIEPSENGYCFGMGSNGDTAAFGHLS